MILIKHKLLSASDFILVARLTGLGETLHRSPRNGEKGLYSAWYEIRQKISVLQPQRRLQVFRVKNIGRVFELRGVAFRRVPPYGGRLLYFIRQNAAESACVVDVVVVIRNKVRQSYISRTV